MPCIPTSLPTLDDAALSVSITGQGRLKFEVQLGDAFVEKLLASRVQSRFSESWNTLSLPVPVKPSSALALITLEVAQVFDWRRLMEELSRFVRLNGRR